MRTKQRIYSYDTVLRDGAQAEGISFSLAGKIRVARRLDELGIDYIEGGYPGSNVKDMEFFAALQRKPLRHARLAAFGSTRRCHARASEDDNLVRLIATGAPTVTIFGKSWKLHVDEVLRTTAGENLAMIADSVRYLKSRGREVCYDAEHFFDGYKDSPAFALATVQAAVEAGADVIVLCDTNGGSLPHEVYEITQALKRRLAVPVGIHAHNDAGVGVANSLEAVRAGATLVQGTINGYGERCGNANLCSILPSLALKMGLTCLPARKLAELRDVSLLVDDVVNMRPDNRAPYVGESAFSHKGGMHVNAVQKNPRTFEHIEPGQVGNARRILVAESSGTSSILLKALELGVEVDKSSPQVREILQTLKDMEGRGYAFESADASFKMLIQKVLKAHKSFFDLEGFRVIVEKRGKNAPCVSEATVKVRVKGEVGHTAGEGDGPVHALDAALRKALMRFYPEIAQVALTDFRVRILDPEEGTAARTRVLIESSDGRQTWGTVGVSENIIEASWQALLDSVEYKLFQEEERARKAKRSAKDKGQARGRKGRAARRAAG